MKILLDTHIILWALEDNPKLSEQARKLIVDMDNHVKTLETLMYHNKNQIHNDPFDRIMIAQAKAEGLKFITHDSKIPFYKENCVLSV